MGPSSTTKPYTKGRSTLGPQERLPERVPMPIFFTPLIFGTILAWYLEKHHVEERISIALHGEGVVDTNDEKKYALLGIGFLLLSMVNSYLSGRVIHARVDYNVPAPNLYASKTSFSADDNDTKTQNATAFNCIQRSHQNFLERYGELVMSIMFLINIVDRPNIAGLVLILVSLIRIVYFMQYQSHTNINLRTPAFVVCYVLSSIGVGYGALLGFSCFLGTKFMN